MKKILILAACIILGSSAFEADAQKPRNYEKKTTKLAENLIRHSKEGDYSKTYKALRNIQKYEFRLQKEDLMQFYTDIHAAVEAACERFGIDEQGKTEMKPIIDALFSYELINAVQ